MASSESPLSYNINWLKLMYKKAFFLPEGFSVAFLTRLFQSGFHVNIPRNPDVT